MSWPTVKLSELCEINIGKTPARANSSYWGEGYPWLSIADMSQGRNLFFTKEEITSLAVNETKIKLVKKGTVLFSFKLSIGKLGIATRDIFTNEAIAALPIKDKSRLCEEYLIYAMSQIDAVGKTDRAVMGATLNKKKLAELEIPLPPLAEQKRIAAILDKADAIRQKRKQAIDLADDFLRSVFLDMFGDPVTNPKGWEVKTIESVCTDTVDCVNRTAPSVDFETPYKMIRTTNIRNYQIDISNVRYVEEDVYLNWIRRLEPIKGDLIFTREAPAGEAGIIDFEDKVFLGQRTMHFRPNEEMIDRTYLLHELMGGGVKRQIARQSAGSTVTHLSVPECKKFKIRVPSKAMQESFGHFVMKVSEKKKKLNEQIVDSDNLFRSLSQRAFSGEL